MRRNMTNAELAILSLVSERPRHGYQIEQVIEERGMRDWTEVGFSSIYYLLKKLEKAGLVAAELQSVGPGPARKVFEATPVGREALLDALKEALAVPHKCYPPLQLGLANLPALPPAEAIAALQQHHASLTGQRDELQAKWDKQKPLPYFVDAMFDYSLTLMEAERAWLAKMIERIEVENEQN